MGLQAAEGGRRYGGQRSQAGMPPAPAMRVIVTIHLHGFLADKVGALLMMDKPTSAAWWLQEWQRR